MSFLGIDIGTSELKALLLDESGSELSCVGVEYQFDRPRPGFAELDPEVLWRTFCNAVRRLVSGQPAHDIRAAALSVQGETFIGVGPDGRAITPAILNIDSRAAAEMDEFVERFGRDALYQKTGLPPHPMYTLPKIAWLRKHCPGATQRGTQFLCLHDYLLRRITGTALIDSSLASRTLGFDVPAGQWDGDLLAAAGIDSSHLSPVASGGVPIGAARADICRELGLPLSVLWVTGGHDQACCSVGAGGLRPRTLVDGTGTFECISVATAQPMLSAAAAQLNVPCERHTAADRFLSLTYAPAGIVLQWCRDELARDIVESAAETGQSSYALMLADAPPGPTGLLFLPYMLGTGTPWLDGRAKAVISGVNLATNRGSLFKAAIEGVTFEMAWNLEMLVCLGITAERIVAVGGGAKSPVWMQLKADIFDREVVSMPGEASCRGAAICAGVGVGVFSSFEEATASLLPSGRSYEPRTEATTRYKELFQEYKDLAHRLYGLALPEGCNPHHAQGEPS